VGRSNQQLPKIQIKNFNHLHRGGARGEPSDSDREHKKTSPIMCNYRGIQQEACNVVDDPSRFIYANGRNGQIKESD